jgi:hypothetical protein
MSEPTTEAGRALLAAYDPCYCEGTVCDVLPDLAARVAAIEAEAAQRSTAEVERLRAALKYVEGSDSVIYRRALAWADEVLADHDDPMVAMANSIGGTAAEPDHDDSEYICDVGPVK